jgi:hypothetical protein
VVGPRFVVERVAARDQEGERGVDALVGVDREGTANRIEPCHSPEPHPAHLHDCSARTHAVVAFTIQSGPRNPKCGTPRAGLTGAVPDGESVDELEDVLGPGRHGLELAAGLLIGKYGGSGG